MYKNERQGLGVNTSSKMAKPLVRGNSLDNAVFDEEAQGLITPELIVEPESRYLYYAPRPLPTPVLSAGFDSIENAYLFKDSRTPTQLDITGLPAPAEANSAATFQFFTPIKLKGNRELDFNFVVKNFDDINFRGDAMIYNQDYELLSYNIHAQPPYNHLQGNLFPTDGLESRVAAIDTGSTYYGVLSPPPYTTLFSSMQIVQPRTMSAPSYSSGRFAYGACPVIGQTWLECLDASYIGVKQNHYIESEAVLGSVGKVYVPIGSHHTSIFSKRYAYREYFPFLDLFWDDSDWFGTSHINAGNGRHRLTIPFARTGPISTGYLNGWQDQNTRVPPISMNYTRSFIAPYGTYTSNMLANVSGISFATPFDPPAGTMSVTLTTSATGQIADRFGNDDEAMTITYGVSTYEQELSDTVIYDGIGNMSSTGAGTTEIVQTVPKTILPSESINVKANVNQTCSGECSSIVQSTAKPDGNFYADFHGECITTTTLDNKQIRVLRHSADGEICLYEQLEHNVTIAFEEVVHTVHRAGNPPARAAKVHNLYGTWITTGDILYSAPSTINGTEYATYSSDDTWNFTTNSRAFSLRISDKDESTLILAPSYMAYMQSQPSASLIEAQPATFTHSVSTLLLSGLLHPVCTPYLQTATVRNQRFLQLGTSPSPIYTRNGTFATDVELIDDEIVDLHFLSEISGKSWIVTGKIKYLSKQISSFDSADPDKRGNQNITLIEMTDAVWNLRPTYPGLDFIGYSYIIPKNNYNSYIAYESRPYENEPQFDYSSEPIHGQIYKIYNTSKGRENEYTYRFCIASGADEDKLTLPDIGYVHVFDYDPETLAFYLRKALRVKFTPLNDSAVLSPPVNLELINGLNPYISEKVLKPFKWIVPT